MRIEEECYLSKRIERDLVKVIARLMSRHDIVAKRILREC